MSLTAADAEHLRDTFKQADTDNSGGLDVEELKAFLVAQDEEVDDEELAELYAVYDGDHDGVLTFEEFVAYVKDVENEDDTLLLRHRFNAIDLDGNGHLDAEEIQKFQLLCGNHLTLEEAQEMIAHMDGDGDGLLTLDDFVQAKRS
jgi:Ca2+-binding EF-hand superfamily protein